jgi:phosphatidylinositol glycan class S
MKEGKAESLLQFIEQERLTTVYSSIFFLTCSLLLGLPLWWHTTTVYRADLPSARVNELLQQKPEILTRLQLSFVDIPTDFADQLSFLLEYELAIKASNTQSALIFRYEIFREEDTDSEKSAYVLSFKQASVDTNMGSRLFKANVDVQLRQINFELRDLRANPETLVSEVSMFIKTYLTLEDDLNEEFKSIVARSDSQSLQQPKKNQADCSRPATSYDILFTLVISEPEHYNIRWKIQSGIENQLLPLLDKFEALAKFKLTSQVLYQMRLGSEVKQEEDGFVFQDKDIPHLISPIERKIGFTLSNSSIINLVVYVPPTDETPLFFADKHSQRSSLAFYSSWGALKIENMHKSTSPQIMNADNQIRAFIPVIKTLLGIRGLEPDIYSGLDPHDVSVLELDMLFRQKALLYVAQAVSTVNSLITLTDQIKNMVIRDEIGVLADDALTLAGTSLQLLSSGADLDKVIESASLANLYAERAFSDPTILAMLYFPEDQKYAIYVPMFVPMSLPLFSSVGIVMGYWKSRKNSLKPHSE